VTRKRIAIVIPVLNDGPSLFEMVRQLAVVLHDRANDVVLVIVDDGSVPPIAASVGEWPGGPFAGRILTLKRNLGHQRALAIGLAYAVEEGLAEVVVTMDADGEDKPIDVPRLLAAIGNDGPAIVVGERIKRSEDLTFRAFYQLYRLMFRLLTGRSIVFGNFAALPLTAARRLVNMGKLWLNLPATILLSRLPIVNVPVARGHRFHGSSQMNLVSLVVHGLRAMAVFVERVLTRIILAALALLLLCIVASAFAIVLKFIGMATPGWVTTVVGVSLVILVATLILCFVSGD
jgi:glycosyltransferase involved in cell wall biosynthesis